MSGLISRLGVWIDARHAAARRRQFRHGWPASASTGVAFYDSPQVQYRYRRAGQGRTIVFTADPPMTLENYDALIDVFAKSFRVIVVELPAMGFSATRAGFGFGFRETNDDLACFLQDVAGNEAIWAFSCVAGLAAIDLAVRRPGLVSHLALIQTGDVAAFSVWKAARDPRGVLAKPVVGQLVMRGLAAKRMPAWYALSVGKQEQVPAFCRCAERSFAHGAMWSLASAYQVYMDETLRLLPPAQPILSLWGGRDRSHPASNRHTLGRFCPALSAVDFEDLGHTPELEDPQRVYDAI